MNLFVIVLIWLELIILSLFQLILFSFLIFHFWMRSKDITSKEFFKSKPMNAHEEPMGWRDFWRYPFEGTYVPFTDEISRHMPDLTDWAENRIQFNNSLKATASLESINIGKINGDTDSKKAKLRLS